MTQRLLQIAVTVERHVDGRYFWRILDVVDGEFVEPLVEGVTLFPTYADALIAGAQMLLSLCDDPEAGPVDDFDSTMRH
jgi:hypothetical protein